jgi:hypothetical protein
MSSLFGEPGSLLNKANNMVFAANTAIQNTTGTRGDWLLYLLVAFFIAVVIFMLMGKTIDWSWIKYFDPRPHSWKVLSRSSLFWAPSSIFTNLVVPKDKSVADMYDDIYSATIETVLYNTRSYTTTEGPYRHIVHRGSNELAQTTVGGAILSGCGANSMTDLPPFGLPKRMNPGIFLDPNTNDIIVFVDTVLGADTFRESLRIADIPLDIPCRIGVVLNKRVLEVYLNCKLEATKVLQGDPKHVENEWYGLAGPAGAQAQIQNLRVWKEGLSADDMRVLCPAIPTFSKERPICSGADTPLPSNNGSASSMTKKIDLGLGTSLTAKC